jgi:hypothetical protein
MASRMFTEYAFTFNKNFVIIEGQFNVLSSQTSDVNNYKCSAVSGSGIKYVANQAAGVYKISLSDRYFKFLGFDASLSGVLGTEVAIADASSGVPYVIKTMGTSVQADWVTAGMPAGVTAAVGVAFTAGAGASGASGNGFVAPIITNSVTDVRVYGVPDNTLNPAVGTDPYLYIQTLAATNSSTTTQIATAPADGTVIRFRLMVRNSNLSIV